MIFFLCFSIIENFDKLLCLTFLIAALFLHLFVFVPYGSITVSELVSVTVSIKFIAHIFFFLGLEGKIPDC